MEMATQRAESGLTPSLPSRRPGISANWRRTSTIIACAARPTDFIVSAAKAKVSIEPMNRPEMTLTSTRLMASRPTAAV